MEIPLTGGLVALVDAGDFASVAALKWAAKTAPDGKVFAVHYFRDGAGRTRSVSMQRFLMGAGPRQRVCHLDGNRLNNSRSSNLRIRRKPPTARVGRMKPWRRFRGVYPTAWGTCRVILRGKYKGSRKTQEEAALLYDQEALKIWGDRAVLNFPDLARASA
jgi:hypothetical protein